MYDPETGTWSPGAEQGRLQLRGGLHAACPTARCWPRRTPTRRNAEKYLITAGTWVSAGQTPVVAGREQLLDRDRALPAPPGRHRVPGRRATATPPSTGPDHDPATPGTWTAGPDFPDSSPGTPLKANDAPGCVLPNGHVLCVAGTAPNNGGYAPERAVLRVRRQAARPGARPRQRGRQRVRPGGCWCCPPARCCSAPGSPAMEIYTPVGEAGRRMAPAHHRAPARPASPATPTRSTASGSTA